MGAVRDFAHDPNTDSKDFEDLVSTIDAALFSIAAALAGPQGRLLERRSPTIFGQLSERMGRLDSANNFLANWGTEYKGRPYEPATTMKGQA